MQLLPLGRRGAQAQADTLRPRYAAVAEDGRNARTSVRLAALLGSLAFVLFFRIGEIPAVNSAEARVEGVVREMVTSGDWLVPRLDGHLRLQKPPGYYWVGAAFSSLTGHTNWTSVRAGSACAAILLVGVTFAWGRALGGPTLGLMAAFLLASMHFTIAFGRRAMADMLLSLFATLALASFDRIHFGQQRRWLSVFAAAFAGAILAKATTALLLVGLPIGLWLALNRSPKRRESRDLLIASALAISVGFSWYVVVLLALPGALRGVLSEAFLPFGVRLDQTAASALHYASPLFFVGPLLTGTLPASVLLPLAIRRGIATRLYSGVPRLRFVAIAFLFLLCALSLIPQKQRHYLLPLLPLLAILLADAILDLQRRAPARVRQALVWGSAIVAPLGFIAFGFYAWFSSTFLGLSLARSVAIIAAAAVLFAALAWSAWRGRARVFAGLALASLLSLELVWYGSLNIWRLEFRAGTAVRRPDFVVDRWQKAGSAHPRIARMLGYAPTRLPAGSELQSRER